MLVSKRIELNEQLAVIYRENRIRLEEKGEIVRQCRAAYKEAEAKGKPTEALGYKLAEAKRAYTAAMQDGVRRALSFKREHKYD